MGWDLNTDDLTKVFSLSDVSLIRDKFTRAVDWTNKFLKVDDVRAHFFVADRTFGLWGLGACAPGPNAMYVRFNPNDFLLRDNNAEGQVRLSAVVAHECHHIMRWRGPGYGSTLGEAMVSEGLALKFQRETQHPDFPDERYLHGAALHTMSEGARAVLDSRPHADGGFRDRRGEPIDRYALGLAVVEGWSKYTGITAAAAYGIPAEEVLRPWRKGKYDIISPACGPR